MVRPSMDGWWQCCQCSAEVNSGWYFRSCTGCGHQYDEYCCYNLGMTAVPFVTEIKVSEPKVHVHLRSRPQYLPILIGRYRIKAFADSGSQFNCIREDYAKYLGAYVEPAIQKHKLPIKDCFIHSIGYTTLGCRFPGEGSAVMFTQFRVFPRFTSRVLFGLEFLASTGTLSIYKHRLKDIETACATEAASLPIIKCVGATEMATIECWINGIPINSLPDTGADLNLISAEFIAAILGSNHSAEKINKFDITTLQFADHSTATTEGTIRLTISFYEPSKCLTSTHELVASALARSSQEKRDRVPSKSRLLETFHVVEGLEQKVILCETLLGTVDAFNQYRRNFVASTREAFDFICVGKEKKGKERGISVQVGPLEDTPARLTDDYNNTSDSYQMAMDRVDERLVLGEIGEEQVPALQDHARQLFFAWGRENKPRFDRFWPGFYEQKFR